MKRTLFIGAARSLGVVTNASAAESRRDPPATFVSLDDLRASPPSRRAARISWLRAFPHARVSRGNDNRQAKKAGVQTTVRADISAGGYLRAPLPVAVARRSDYFRPRK